MAQTGYTPIQHYYSITGGNTPTTGNLTLGEIAINVADQKVYMLNSASNAVVTLVGTLGNQNANSVSITGGTVNATTIGATTASTGAFTTISATGVITSTVSTGTAPFTVSSTTQVANLNAATAGTATNATNTAITDNTSSSATWYPTIVSATTGNLPQTTSSTKLSFVPSTGTLSATVFSGSLAASNITGTLGVANGGTGLTSLTAGYIPYGNGTSAFNSSSTHTYNGTTLSAGNFVPSSSSIPSNGIYLPSTNSLGFSTNSNLAATIFSSGGVSIGNTTDPGAGNLSLNSVISTIFFTAINSSTPTTIATGLSFIAVVRDRGNGGSALVLYENNNTPVIISQVGNAFTTVSPLSTQIQLANLSGGNGMTALGGSARNGDNINISVIKNQ
jgi:hypothetical protein